MIGRLLAKPLRGVIPGCLVLAASAFAQSPEIAVTVSVERERVQVDDQGRSTVRREPVDMARPGDVLVYTVHATNQGVAPAVGARIVDPIPGGTVLLVNAVESTDRPSRASIDGGRTWQDFPARIQSFDAEGRVRLVPAPAEDYTHLRWDVPGPLGPGESRDFSFKVRVN